MVFRDLSVTSGPGVWGGVVLLLPRGDEAHPDARLRALRRGVQAGAGASQGKAQRDYPQDPQRVAARRPMVILPFTLPFPLLWFCLCGYTLSFFPTLFLMLAFLSSS